MIEPHIFIFVSEKGGVRKTSSLTAFVEHSALPNSDFRIFEIDDQPRLKGLFPGQVTTIRLPDLEQVRRDDLADADALTPLLEAIIDRQVPVIVVDVASSVDGRMFETMLQLDLGGAAAEAGCRIVAFTPFTTEQDALALAARSVARTELVLPEALIIPVHAETGERVEDLSKGKQKLVGSLTAGRTVIRHPRLLPRALAAVEATGNSAYRLAQLPMGDAVAHFVAAGVPRIQARGIWAELVQWQDNFGREFDRLPFLGRPELAT